MSGTAHEQRTAAQDPSVDARIGAAWKELRRGAAMSALRDHLFGAGDDALEPGQVDTLELLVARDSWRMSELADALRVDPSTATRAVQRLVKAGMAERTACASDARVVMVSATAMGRSRQQSINDLRRETLTAMLSSFGPSEREQFAEYMDRFVTALDEFVRELGNGS
jgi:DNA-binding MarR family transcriptional regulator